LAAVCERWRDRDRAAAIYQRLLQSGHRGAAPLAAVQLGLRVATPRQLNACQLAIEFSV
jgi:hypothetical protein